MRINFNNKGGITVNFYCVTKMMGVLLIVLGLSLIPAFAVGLIYGENREAFCFLVTLIPCIVAGFAITKIFSREVKTKARDGYIIVAFAWLFASIIGAVPLCISGTIPNPFDAFFEVCSGFSTTGASILTVIEGLPKSMLFWRSFTHWLGGMGIIVLATALLPSIGISGQIVASAETPGPTLTKISARFSDNSRNLYVLYIIFTVAETFFLKLGGMSFYDSLVHSFSTVGTGGFSTYNNSIAHFTSPYIQWVIIIFMFLCGVNFNLFFLLVRGKVRDFFKDEEFRLYFFLILGAIVLMVMNLMTQGNYTNLGKCIRDSAFQTVSVITTTGFMTADFDLWPAFCKTLILLIMITGACSSSTGGGIKIIRILVAIKFVKRGFFMKLHPKRVAEFSINKRGVSQSVITNIVNFIFFYILILFAGTLVISFEGFDIVTCFSSVLTCLSNVGPGFNLVGPTMNFSIFSDFSKTVLGLLMIAGRLELFTFFMLFSRKYWNSNRV